MNLNKQGKLYMQGLFVPVCLSLPSGMSIYHAIYLSVHVSVVLLYGESRRFEVNFLQADNFPMGAIIKIVKKS